MAHDRNPRFHPRHGGNSPDGIDPADKRYEFTRILIKKSTGSTGW
jgi:hypothetical protein